MTKPAVCLLLHAHLPFVRHAEDPYHLEETWVYEGLAGCYLPLLMLLDAWERDGLQERARLTLSVSPPLAAMLDDPLIRERFVEYARARITLAEREARQLQAQPAMARLARMYRAHYQAVLERFEVASRDLLGALVAHARRSPMLELMSCPGTHPFAPLYASQSELLRPHVALGKQLQLERFGGLPHSIWLAECGYTPALEPLLRSQGIRGTVLDAHALQCALPAASHGPFAPVRTPQGLVVLGRDPISARQIWSRESGYPAQAAYREFHLDLVDLASAERLGDLAHPAGLRRPTGLKYWRIGNGGAKQTYVPEAAHERVRHDAHHFVTATRQRGATLAAQHPELDRPVFVMPFDAELFGHWWFEGPSFLDAVMRGFAAQGDALTPVSMRELVEEGAARSRQVIEPTTSSWGMNGYAAMWLNEQTDAYQVRLWHLGEALRSLAAAPSTSVPLSQAPEIERQLLTEWMLAQASDWPFLLRANTHATYAAQRLEEHLTAAETLLAVLRGTAPFAPAYLAKRQACTPYWPQLGLASISPADEA